MANIPRKDESNTKNVCILHFEEKYIKATGIYTTLEKDAIPSLFFYGDNNLQNEKNNETSLNDIVFDFENFKSNFQARVLLTNWQCIVKDSEVSIYKLKQVKVELFMWITPYMSMAI